MSRFGKTGITAVLVAAIAVYGTGAIAMEMDGHNHQARSEKKECGRGGEQHHHFSHILHLKKELKLTGKQAGEISDIMEEEHAKAKPLFEAIQKERKALKLLSLAEKTDATAIKAQAAKLAEAESGLALHHAQVHKRIAGVMTPEQAAKFVEMRKNMVEQHGAAGGHHKRGCDQCTFHKHKDQRTE